MKKKYRALKDYPDEVKLVGKRITIAAVIIVCLTGFLIGRLAFLQIVNHQKYQTLSQHNQIDLEPVAPARGLIYDRNGVLLAKNIPVFSLDIIPNKVKHLAKTLKEINQIIPLDKTDLKQFYKQYKQGRHFEEIPLKLRLTSDEVAKFSVDQHRFPGVLIKARLMRFYPEGPAFAHVLGHVGRINDRDLSYLDPTNYSATHYVGKVGIEKYYENQLHGKVGYKHVEVDAKGKTVRVLNQIKATGGDNLYLTIDSLLQKKAQKIMKDHLGVIIALKPDTGEVLALVSNPTYDPNIFIGGISIKDYATLTQDKDKPLFNRAIRGLYPIASTIKPFLALAGLDYGVVTPEMAIKDPGWYTLPNNKHVFRDWKRKGHGIVDLRKAIAVSCDTYFYDLAHKLGIKRIDEFLTYFGLGKSTKLDMPEEITGNIPTPEWKWKMHGQSWYAGDTVLTGIGQSYVQITPINLATSVAAIAERGQRYRPHLLYKRTNANHLSFRTKPIEETPVILKDYNEWHIVIEAMQDVIRGTYGTGFRFGRNPNYTIAAKTGTVQVVRLPEEGVELPERLRDHSIFVGFAPVNHPKIAIVVLVENSALASPLARKIMDYYLLKRPKETV